jgi:hypothetical protein
MGSDPVEAQFCSAVAPDRRRQGRYEHAAYCDGWMIDGYGAHPVHPACSAGPGNYLCRINRSLAERIFGYGN